MMTMKQTQLYSRTFPQRDQASGDLDPAELGATLRELALRVHRLVLATHGLGPGAGDSGPDLAKVHAEIVCLQQNLGTDSQGEIAKYVSALRNRVEKSQTRAIGFVLTVLFGGLTEGSSGFPWYTTECPPVSKYVA